MPRLTINPQSEWNDTFFISIKTINGLPIFINDKYFRIILRSLEYCRKNKGIKIFAYSLLINHLHLVFKILENFKVIDFLRDFKHYTATQTINLLSKDKRQNILNQLEKAALAKDDQKYKLWKRDVHPESITSNKFFEEKIHYTDFNPVHHQVVGDIEDYPYASFHNHYCEHEVVFKTDSYIII